MFIYIYIYIYIYIHTHTHTHNTHTHSCTYIHAVRTTRIGNVMSFPRVYSTEIVCVSAHFLDVVYADYFVTQSTDGCRGSGCITSLKVPYDKAMRPTVRYSCTAYMYTYIHANLHFHSCNIIYIYIYIYIYVYYAGDLDASRR